MSMAEVTVVLDIGKTNIKSSALDLDTGECLAVVRRPNEVIRTGLYPHADVDAIWSWFKAQLSEFTRTFKVNFITCTTHGATAVCLAGDEICLPVLDYEHAGCEECDSEYSKFRPSFAETGSPAMGFGLNLGRQLFWQSKTFDEQFSQCDTVLMYPQFWCWLLSGVKCSEITSLGCHTDLWSPKARDFSTMVRALGWSGLFPEVAPTGVELGPIRTELAEELGLPQECKVLNGIHDSNASLMPYLLTENEPFSVISTGTWVVAAAIGSESVEMVEELDMLFNVNAFGDPVACMRFMGGREWELLKGADAFSEVDFNAVLKHQPFVIPGFASQGGPFRQHKGYVDGLDKLENDGQKSALASLYLALMTDYCLDCLGSAGTLFLEGSFTNNPTYTSALQALRPRQNLRISSDSTGTTLGAAILLPQIRDAYSQSFCEVAPLSQSAIEKLDNYKAIWRGKVKKILH